MFRWLLKSLGFIRDDSTQQTEYDPVYGLPRRSLDEWLARNPQLREEYEVLEWLARNPPLRREYEEARKQGFVTPGGRPRRAAGGAASFSRIPDATADEDTGPKTAPQTDPTNPYRQESAGMWRRNEEVSVWKEDEPGLTDRDRAA